MFYSSDDYLAYEDGAWYYYPYTKRYLESWVPVNPGCHDSSKQVQACFDGEKGSKAFELESESYIFTGVMKYMFDIGKVFEVVDGEWYYFPFTRDVKPNIFMKVREGSKEEFEAAIQNEWKLAYSAPALTTGLMVFHPLWLVLPFVVYFYCLTTIRGRNERKYCYYESYDSLAFFDGYFRNLYRSIEVDDPVRVKAGLCGFPVVCFLTFSAYFKMGVTFWFYVLMIFCVIFLFQFIITFHKWWSHKNRKNN